MLFRVRFALFFAISFLQITAIHNIVIAESTDPLFGDDYSYTDPKPGQLVNPVDLDMDGEVDSEQPKVGKPVIIPPPTPTPTATPTPTPPAKTKPEKEEHDDWCPGLGCLVCPDCLWGVLQVWGEALSFDGIRNIPPILNN